jgi:hypothetical protein
MNILFAAVHESGCGTFLPCQPRRAMSGFRGKAVEKCSLGDFLILTRTGRCARLDSTQHMT